MRWNIKLSCVTLILSLTQVYHAQNYTVHNKNKTYLSVVGGMNFSLPKVTDRYSVLSSNEDNFDKEYDKFGKVRGVEFGLRINHYFSNSIALVVGVGYQSLGFNYFTNYSWIDTLQNQEFSREMYHQQRISYFNVPIMAKWDLTKGQLKPFIQGGVYMDFRHQGKKVIYYDNTIDGEVEEKKNSSSPTVPITDYTRKFNIGLIGGVGLNYHTKYFTFGLESNFRFGFNKVMNDENRYADINGFALQYLDVLDQLKLSALNVQLSVSVPLNNAVHSNILRKTKYYKRR
jgi:hypothetical protein